MSVKIKIIAEIGINHNGDLEKAKRMIRKSAEAGADVVKFQKRTIDLCYTKEFLDSPRESPWGTTQRAQKEGLEFSVKQYEELKAEADACGVGIMVSVWDVNSAETMRWLSDSVKIPSAMAIDRGLRDLCAARYKRLYIATGGCTQADFDVLANIEHRKDFTDSERPEVFLIHCVAAYPAPIDLLNLGRLRWQRSYYGWSSHVADHDDPGILDCVAIGAGALYVERHVTEDRNDYGSDQSMSLNFEQFALAVKRMRLAEKAVTTRPKEILECEIEPMRKLREHLNQK
jgi:N-acetylneuraminate synthase